MKRNETERFKLEIKIRQIGTERYGTERNGMARNKSKSALLHFGAKHDGTERNEKNRYQNFINSEWYET